jgi:hypothetical protein
VVDIEFDAPVVKTVDGFQLVEIPGAMNVPFHREPILPVSAAFVLPKSPGFSFHGLSWSKLNEETLGLLAIPGITTVSSADPLFGPFVRFVSSEGEGEYPITEVDVVENGEDLTVMISPVRHNPSSRETVWSSTWRLAIEYTSSVPVALGETRNATEVVGGSGAAIPFTLAVQNLSETAREVISRVTLGGVTRESSPCPLTPGASGTLEVDWTGDLPPGTHEAEIVVVDGGQEVAVTTKQITIRQGSIRSFAGPSSVRPDTVANFVVTVRNEDSEPHEVTYRIAILDVSGAEVSGIPGAAGVAAGTEATTTLPWNSGEMPMGEYVAQLRAYAEGGLWGIRSWNFRISTNQRPVAVCSGPQALECVAGAGVAPLDGSGSFDPDGDPLAFAWSSTTCTLDLPDSSTPTATCGLGEHTASLVVRDATEASEPCTSAVSVVDTTPPILEVPPAPAAECESEEGAAVSLAAVSSDQCDSVATCGNDRGSGGCDASGVYPLGATTVNFFAEDGSGNSATRQVVVEVVDTRPPLLDCPPDVTVECQSAGQAWVALAPAAALDDCSAAVSIANGRTAGGADATGSYPVGTTAVRFTATDPSGNAAECLTNVTVRDTIPPDIAAHSTPDVLWPPNHKMAEVSVAISASDACDPNVAIELFEALSSEPDDAKGGGDGHTLADVQDADLETLDSEVSLRAERDGTGSGRVYSLRYRAVDFSGNQASVSAEVRVPHSLSDVVEPVVLTAAGGENTTLSWDTVDGATHYDVIRGDLSALRVNGSWIELGRVVLVEGGFMETSTAGHPDSEVPPIGQAFFYLVQFHDGLGHSSFGTESAGREYRWDGPTIP